jgi:hypothetical protein
VVRRPAGRGGLQPAVVSRDNKNGKDEAETVEVNVD